MTQETQNKPGEETAGVLVPFANNLAMAAQPEDATGQVLRRDFWTDVCKDPNRLKINWKVNAKLLQTKDKQHVSQSVEILQGCFFKLLLTPTPVGDKKGQACFRKARGWASVELKMTECHRVPPILS